MEERIDTGANKTSLDASKLVKAIRELDVWVDEGLSAVTFSFGSDFEVDEGVNHFRNLPSDIRLLIVEIARKIEECNNCRLHLFAIEVDLVVKDRIARTVTAKLPIIKEGRLGVRLILH